MAKRTKNEVIVRADKWTIRRVEGGYRMQKPNPDAPLSLEDMRRLLGMLQLAVSIKEGRETVAHHDQIG